MSSLVTLPVLFGLEAIRAHPCVNVLATPTELRRVFDNLTQIHDPEFAPSLDVVRPPASNIETKKQPDKQTNKQTNERTDNAD